MKTFYESISYKISNEQIFNYLNFFYKNLNKLQNERN